VSYRLGGEHATVTDADAVLGYSTRTVSSAGSYP